MNRRAFVVGAAGVSALAALGFATRRPRDPHVFRVGVMANLTHAPLLAAIGSGRLEGALAPLSLETMLFRAGPRVTEALLGDAIDVGTTGPAPVVIHHARHARAGGLRVLGGCASGGASLVIGKGSGIATATDLRGKLVAVTQLGTTQDVALRTYLRTHDLRDKAAGGDVTVLAIAGATILDQMRRGTVHAAWVPEPWGTRLVHELDAARFVDERDLWPDHRFATSVLAARADRAASTGAAIVKRVLAEEVARANAHPAATRDEAYAELTRRVGNPGARAIFDAAWSFVDFTTDPLRETIEKFGIDASRLGLCPADATRGLFAS